MKAGVEHILESNAGKGGGRHFHSFFPFDFKVNQSALSGNGTPRIIRFNPPTVGELADSLPKTAVFRQMRKTPASALPAAAGTERLNLRKNCDKISA
jgi:hypothetical protein